MTSRTDRDPMSVALMDGLVQTAFTVIALLSQVAPPTSCR